MSCCSPLRHLATSRLFCGAVAMAALIEEAQSAAINWGASGVALAALLFAVSASQSRKSGKLKLSERATLGPPNFGRCKWKWVGGRRAGGGGP